MELLKRTKFSERAKGLYKYKDSEKHEEMGFPEDVSFVPELKHFDEEIKETKKLELTDDGLFDFLLVLALYGKREDIELSYKKIKVNKNV